MKYEESPTVELKSTLYDDVKKEILAFLNSHGGIIYVGVNNDGTLAEPHSLRGRDAMDSRLGDWVREAFFPAASNFITHDYNADGVLTIRVEEGNNKPYFLREKGPKPSGVYIRDGRSTRKANEDEIMLMILSSKDYRFEDDISNQQGLSFVFLENMFNDKGFHFDERSLVTLGLRKPRGPFTNLGLIFSNQSPFVIKIAEYDENLNFKVKKTLSGSLLKVLYDTQEICERFNNVSAVIGGSSFERTEIVSYPGASLREMILNAFCHANYFVCSNIKIEFFPTECRITSPGGIFHATLDDLMSGIQTYRNPKLVNIFYKLGLIENFGTGIPRTFMAYASNKRKPEITVTENHFIVYLPNLSAQENKTSLVYHSVDRLSGRSNNRSGDRINDRINDRLNEVCHAILSFIKTHPGSSVDDIYKELSSAYETITTDSIYLQIKRYLRDYLEFRGPKKTGGYYLK